MSAFRFSTAGNRIDDELFAKLKEARRMGLHGDLQFVKVLPSGRFEVTTASGGTKVLAGTVRLSNLLQKEMEEEPARRVAWKASHQAQSEASRNGGSDSAVTETSETTETKEPEFKRW